MCAMLCICAVDQWFLVVEQGAGIAMKNMENYIYAYTDD